MKVKKAGRIISRKLFLLCLNQGKVVEDYVFAVVDTLIKERPRQYLQILRELTRRIRLALADSQARVQSAVPLSSRERSFVKEKLISFYSKDLEVQFEDSAKILGGLRIQIGSEIWDGTVLSYLGRVSSFLLDI